MKNSPDLFQLFLISFSAIYIIISIAVPEVIIRINELLYGITGLKVDRSHSRWSPQIIRLTGFLGLGLGIMIIIGIYINHRISH